MNDTVQSGEDVIREMDARLAKAHRKYWIWLGSVCAIPIAITAALWLIAVLT